MPFERSKGVFCIKAKKIPQAVYMKVKVYETEIRTRDERETCNPVLDKRKGQVCDDGQK